MEKKLITINNVGFDAYFMNTVIAGTGAAGFNAADSLYDEGVTDIAMITEGVKLGTSRNTGSDKQTFYKLTLAGGAADSVAEMAKTYFGGGSMHGDIALVEAALSARNFNKLVNCGVPFPHNKYGEYVGYKTDHDPRMRATSTGPYTSRYMTERLEASAVRKKIKIFDGYLIIDVLTDPGRARATGLAALDLNNLNADNFGLTFFLCENIIYALGGPGDIYSSSVYPHSQTGGTGVALRAGAKGINLTESQYGLASVKFRWNLSGTYQQVIPRYVSTDKDMGGEREFLGDFFTDAGSLLAATFLKGYEWPFDPRKLKDQGSSNVDALVYNETNVKNRRVFLDFTRNPSCALNSGSEFDFSLLKGAAGEYLKNSGALFGTPIERLRKMNPAAIELYASNGIDISREYLECAVCAQHNNGGLMGNIWWESNLKHFFPAGEINGTFGVYRPGGSALNSTQTGSLRAAQFIAKNYGGGTGASGLSSAEKKADEIFGRIKALTGGGGVPFGADEIKKLKDEIKRNMSANGAHIRSLKSAADGADFCLKKLAELESGFGVSSPDLLPEFFKIKNILYTQLAYLKSIEKYISDGGKSRGSYLVAPSGAENGGPGEIAIDTENSSRALVTELKPDNSVECYWESVRPIPEEDDWFENIWRDYRNGVVFARCE